MAFWNRDRIGDCSIHSMYQPGIAIPLRKVHQKKIKLIKVKHSLQSSCPLIDEDMKM